MAVEKKTRRWWASIGTGGLLCVGCCLAPLLITAGILGSGTLLISLSWLEPIGFALIGIGVAGLIWAQRRARRKRCSSAANSTSSSCAGSGCGCATASTAT